MPAPPARSFSASVPCGVSSTSSSPDRNWRANSLFSPTYELTILRMRRSASSSPSPQSSTPQLLLTTSRSVTPASSSAWMSPLGMPHSPTPPTASVLPSGMSATASAALATVLSIIRPPLPRGLSQQFLSFSLDTPPGGRKTQELSACAFRLGGEAQGAGDHHELHLGGALPDLQDLR